MAFGPITSWQIDGETVETVRNFILGGSKITADGDCSHEIKTLAPCKKSYDQPRQHIKKQRYYFASKGPSSQSYGFSSSHVGEGNGNQLQHSCLENPRGRSLVGCCLWGRTESDMTDVTLQQQQHVILSLNTMTSNKSLFYKDLLHVKESQGQRSTKEKYK